MLFLLPAVSVAARGTPGGSASAASPMGCFADGLSTDVLPSFLFARAVRAEISKNPWIPADGMLARSPAAGHGRGLRGLSGGGFVQGHVHSEIFVLLPSELCSEERRLCQGQQPSLSHLCFRAHAQFDGNVF